MPRCTYCDEPLGANELDYDPETGRESYYSAHLRCSSNNPDGEFYVTSYLDGEIWPRGQRLEHNSRRYTTLKRASSEARYLADSNNDRWDFHVFDMEHDSPRATFTGRR